MKILLAVDGSPYTRKMLAWLAAHDELLGAEGRYTFLTVVPPVPAHVTRFIDRATLDDHHREQAHNVLDPISAFARQQPAWRCDTRWQVGHPGETIAQVAEEGAYDLVAMGSHGHGAVLNLALGSVTQRVLSGCKVPVLIVR